MKTDFIPIDYDYFDFKGKNYIKIIGRNSEGKRVCVLDTCNIYLWAILKNNLSDKKIKKLISKIKQIKLDTKGRNTKVEKVEIKYKNFLGKSVKALKIFATNYKDLHDIADKLGYDEIEKRRGYDIGFITHYIIEKKINPLKWYEIQGNLAGEEFQGIENLDVDFSIVLEKVKEKSKENFSPKTLAYDIETDELKVGKGEILMVSLVGKNYKKVITWKKSNKTPSYVEQVKDESELIEKFVEEVRNYSPDFLVGYFSDGFDLPYLRARAEKHQVDLKLGLDDSKPRFHRGAVITGKISGIIHLDLLKFIQTVYSQYMKSETLSLNEVAKEFLDEEKKDFKIKHSSELKEKSWKKYFEYNLHDSKLTFDLFNKFWPDMLEFTRTIQEPVFDVTRNGLSKQVEGYILHNLEKFDEIPEKRPNYDEIGLRRRSGKVEGAYVFEPQPGLYEDIVFFDFTSMHTSIIISMNISGSTLIKEPNKTEKKKSNSIETSQGTFYFEKQQGFIPLLLKEIFEQRKKYKKRYKKNPNRITLARSNAFKLLSASIHGYIGFFGARYYSKEASASILAYVRKFNKQVIEDIKKQGQKVLYGDSVGKDTKIIVKKNQLIYEEKIEKLFEKIDKKSILGKEYNFKDDLEILTLDDKGNSVFKPLIYVMRHKCKKQMYKIHFTNNWNIDVTKDHSLIAYQSSKFNQKKEAKKNPLKRIVEIKPNEIGKKAHSIVSLKKIPSVKIKSKNFPKEVYEFIGYFIGDGSFSRNKFHKKYDKDYYLKLSLGLDSEEIIQKIISPLMKKKYIKNFWKSKTRKGDITINGQRLIKIISKYFRDKRGRKIIPEWIFYEKEENVASFLRGLFSADGTVLMRNNAPIIKYVSTNKNYINETRKLLYKMGVSHSSFKETTPNAYKTKEKTYSNNTYSKHILIKNKKGFMKKIGFLLDRKNKQGRIKTNPQQKKLIKKFEFDLQQVKKIEKIKSQKYVYDLEVEDTHTFFANYVLAHNTDSIAFTRENKNKKEVKKLLKELNENLPGIMELELEGFFKRGLWVTTRSGKVGAKKKYALLDEDGNFKIRGFETVRRDWCALAREVQNKVIEHILKEGDEKNAFEYVKKIIEKLKNREIPLEELIIKTQLKKPVSEYKSLPPHVQAAKRMKRLEIPVSSGNLIEYYIADLKLDKKNPLVRERVRLPVEDDLYDIEYYLKHQLLPAVENIFQIFDINTKEIIDGKKQMKLGDF